MSADRELLERAAVAAGLKVTGAGYNHMSGEHWLIVEPQGHWRPLTDDGDALRLARSLGMGIAWMRVYVAGSNPMIEVAIEDTSDLASVRRAIVECAARLAP